MSEWWKYRLSDFLMYTHTIFERLLEAYNAWLFPAQALAIIAGTWLVWVAWRGSTRQLQIALGVLSASWLWVAWMFFYQRLATIDLAAPNYAYGFAIEGVLLLWAGWRFGKDRHSLALPQRRLGAALIAIAVFVLPLIAPLLGGSWKAIALFGLTPDATALATLGMIIVLGTARWLSMIPLLWCIASGALLWNLGAAQALVLPLLGVGALAVLFWERRVDRHSPLS